MDPVRAGLTLLRVAVASMMIVHGVARASLGIVDDFGVVLGRWGFPAGVPLAWAITVVEIAGGAALALGRAVRPLALWFMLQLAAGVYLIHGPAGWFVVGAGRNGAEYSVLLITCLIVVVLADEAAYRVGGRMSSPRAAAASLVFLLLAAGAPGDLQAQEFPGQYAAPPSEWRYPVWPSGCRRFTGEEQVACLQFVADNYAGLGRYAAANGALGGTRPGQRRVVFFGDSITDNWSKPGYGGFFPGKPYVNRGIGGQTTSQMLLRFRPDVIELRPDVVVILAGTNDIAGNSGPVTLDTVQDNLASMAELAKANRIRVVLASLLPVSDDKKDQQGQPVTRTRDRPPAKIRELNEWLARYARDNGHVYLDYFAATAHPTGLLRGDLNDDGLHPNAAGYAVMAPLAEKAIAAALAGR
ncbi:MAG TPA: GDSL-type esterase/lipase family protein [Vicinamibacteria bacterium]